MTQIVCQNGLLKVWKNTPLCVRRDDSSQAKGIAGMGINTPQCVRMGVSTSNSS